MFNYSNLSLIKRSLELETFSDYHNLEKQKKIKVKSNAEQLALPFYPDLANKILSYFNINDLNQFERVSKGCQMQTLFTWEKIHDQSFPGVIWETSQDKINKGKWNYFLTLISLKYNESIVQIKKFLNKKPNDLLDLIPIFNFALDARNLYLQFPRHSPYKKNVNTLTSCIEKYLIPLDDSLSHYNGERLLLIAVQSVITDRLFNLNNNPNNKKIVELPNFILSQVQLENIYKKIPQHLILKTDFFAKVCFFKNLANDQFVVKYAFEAALNQNFDLLHQLIKEKELFLVVDLCKYYCKLINNSNAETVKKISFLGPVMIKQEKNVHPLQLERKLYYLNLAIESYQNQVPLRVLNRIIDVNFRLGKMDDVEKFLQQLINRCFESENFFILCKTHNPLILQFMNDPNNSEILVKLLYEEYNQETDLLDASFYLEKAIQIKLHLKKIEEAFIIFDKLRKQPGFYPSQTLVETIKTYMWQ